MAHAAQKYPEFNGHFNDGQFQPIARVHAGMTVNLRGGGLVAPAIHDTHELDVDTLMIRMRDLIERVRQGRFRASELADPTITVSSLGERGVLSLYGVIYPPQVAIIGFGTPTQRPWVTDDNVLKPKELHKIAPDIEFNLVDTEEDLREEFDLDSMDFLRLVTALGKHFDIPIPESDYSRMSSFTALCCYLDELSS